MPQRIAVADQALDAAFANRPKAGKPVTVAEAEALAAETPPFVRDKVPTGSRQREEWVQQMLDWYPEGATWYHPDLQENVTKQEGNIVIVSSGAKELDEAAWVAAGMRGAAPKRAGLDTESVLIEIAPELRKAETVTTTGSAVPAETPVTPVE